MKHKRFTEVFPYTYYIRHKKSDIKYYGVRYANVKRSLSPSEDLVSVYRTSIVSKHFRWIKKRLRTHPEEFEYRPHYTFDTAEEALQYEMEITRKIYKRKDWANQSAGENTFFGVGGKEHHLYGKEVSEERRQKLSKSHLRFHAENPDFYAGVKNNRYGKHPPYIGISPEGEVHKITEGISLWARERGLSETAINKCARGKYKTHLGWRFFFEKNWVELQKEVT